MSADKGWERSLADIAEDRPLTRDEILGALGQLMISGKINRLRLAHHTRYKTLFKLYLEWTERHEEITDDFAEAVLELIDAINQAAEEIESFPPLSGTTASIYAAAN
jgi:hypothetical protein